MSEGKVAREPGFTVDGREPRTVQEFALCLDWAEEQLREARAALAQKPVQGNSPTPRTDALVQVIEGGHEYAPLDRLLPHARALERELAEARAMADSFVCDFIRNESGASSEWDEIGTDPEGMEPYLVYAAKRGLIERDPENSARLRFTKAGEEFL